MRYSDKIIRNVGSPAVGLPSLSRVPSISKTNSRLSLITVHIRMSLRQLADAYTVNYPPAPVYYRNQMEEGQFGFLGIHPALKNKPIALLVYLQHTFVEDSATHKHPHAIFSERDDILVVISIR